MDLSQENFKAVQDTPELILHTLEKDTTNLLLGTSMIQQILNNRPPTTTPLHFSDASPTLSSATLSSRDFSDTDSKTDLDEDILDDTVDDLKADIKHLKFKICKLNNENKELVEETKKLNCELKRKTVDYSKLQIENIELLFTKENKDPMAFLMAIGSGISIGAAITFIYKLWR